MFEEKLESAVNELLKNKNPKKKSIIFKKCRRSFTSNTIF